MAQEAVIMHGAPTIAIGMVKRQNGMQHLQLGNR